MGNYPAIRGREQQMIDRYGGALSDPYRVPGAKSANSIRGVSMYNPFGRAYHGMSNLIFGPLSPYTGF